jgi:signal transduction histidine kinase
MFDFTEALTTVFNGQSVSEKEFEGFNPVEIKILKECEETVRKRSLTESALFENGRMECLSDVCGTNIKKIANDLEDISRLESDELKLNIEHVNVKTMIFECMEKLHKLAEEKALTLTVHLDSQPLKIYGDSERLKQALSHVLCNAVNFVTKGGAIEVLAKGLPQEIMISVVDNGIGISPNRQKKIFQRFRDAEEHPEIEGHGLGIGLNLVEHLIKLHSGKVWVESREKQGSRFSFCIPRQMLCNYLKPKKIKPLFS